MGIFDPKPKPETEETPEAAAEVAEPEVDAAEVVVETEKDH
jgi:hypothetical protein